MYGDQFKVMTYALIFSLFFVAFIGFGLYSNNKIVNAVSIIAIAFLLLSSLGVLLSNIRGRAAKPSSLNIQYTDIQKIEFEIQDIRCKRIAGMEVTESDNERYRRLLTMRNNAREHSTKPTRV